MLPAVFDKSRQVHLKQAVTALMLVASVAACTKWVPDSRPLPTEQVKGASNLRVHTVDGKALIMNGAWLRADSIVGWSAGRGVTVAAADVTKIERQAFDGAKTGVVLGGVGLVVGGFVAMGSWTLYSTSDLGPTTRPPIHPSMQRWQPPPHSRMGPVRQP